MLIRLHKLNLILFVGLFLTLPVVSQTLTISSSTQTASSGTTWVFSNNELTVHGNSTINSSTIVSWLGSSSLTILGATNDISVDVNEDIYSSSAGNGLTIGSTNSTGTVTFNNTVSLMGPLTVYANNIRMGSTVVANLQSAQLLAGGSSGSISLYAKNGFESLATSGTTRGKIMATGGGNIHINADTESNNSGELNIDWLTFDSGTGNIILEASSYVWNTGSSVTLPEFYGSGILTIKNVPGANQSFTTAWISIVDDFSGLILGSDAGIENNTLAACTVCNSSAKNYSGTTFEVAGPINLYGSNVFVETSFKSTAADADILLKAKNSIIVNANRTITSNNGDITFWANADGTANATDGDFIGIQNAVFINSANGLTNQSSGGGTITMAGGNTSQTLASGTIVPTGYAYSNRTTNWGPLLPPGGVNFGYSTAANSEQNSLSIYSGGGDIVIKGKSHSSSAGIQWFSGMPGASQIINSGNGTILFDGLSTSTNAHGIELNSYVASGGVTPNITSSSSSSSAIKFIGETFATALRAGFQGAATLIANATGGGIEISGKTPSASTYGAVEAGGILTYALTGPITFIGDGSGGLKIGGTWGKGSLPSSSSNIILRTNAFTFANPTIETTGTITVEPFGNSFTNALSFPITNLSLPNTITGLTLGKSTNTSDITIASATAISGPVAIYGGNINLDQNINTSGGVASGDIFCKASGNITQASGMSITTAGGDVTLWSNSDATGVGYVLVNGGASSGISTGGGHIFLGGGTDLATGYAKGSDVVAPSLLATGIAGVHLGSGSALLSGNGNITLRGENFGGSTTQVQAGVMGCGTTLEAGTGKIAIYGKASGSGTVNAQGISREGTGVDNWIIRSSNSSSDAIQLIGDASFCNNSYTSLGVNFIGQIESSGGGGILLHGKASSATSYDQGLDVRGNVLANSGTITLKGENNSSADISVFLGTYSTLGTTLGFKTGTNITASTSNIIIQGDNININTVTPVNTSGALTIEPVNTSFANTFTYPNANLTLANTVGGLTIGKTGNTANITIGASTSIAGPITLYGTSIALSNALTSSNATTGNISLNGTTLTGSSAITLQTGRTLTFNLSANTTYTGVISGTGLNVIKEGAGVLALTGSNTPDFATLTISAGTFKLNANQQLTLSDALTNNGTLTLENGATFKQGTSVSGGGTYNIQQNLDNCSDDGTNLTGRFWYLGSPVTSLRENSFGNTGNLNKVWSFTNGAYTTVADGATLSPTTGYVHRRGSNASPLTFTGTNLYAQDVTLSLSNNAGTYAGWHLVSNPYTAYLDWHQVAGSNLSSNLSNTYYIRSYNSNNQDVDALISYNASSGLESNTSSLSLTSAQAQYIAPMQAIWVKVNPTTPLSATAGQLRLERAFTSHQTGNVGLKNTGIYPVLARVNLHNGAMYDQALVYMNEFMTNSSDQNDSEKMFVSGVASIYTMASGKKLVMNGLKNNKKKISVPLYLELPTSKVYQLQLSEYIMEDGLILLEDKQEGTIQDFTINDTYAFYANSGVLSNRFVLHFFMPDNGITAQGPSNNWVEEESAINEGGSILVSSNGRGKVTITQDIDATPSEKGSVMVRDAAGREIYNGQLTGSATNIELDAPSGIYFVEVELNGQVEVKKIFVQQ